LVEFTPDGKLKRPVGYRQWVYVGTPLAPNDLNGGEATLGLRLHPDAVSTVHRFIQTGSAMPHFAVINRVPVVIEM
jgi:hypothetical protein